MKYKYILREPHNYFTKHHSLKDITIILDTLSEIPKDHRRQMQRICEVITEHGFIFGGGTGITNEAELIKYHIANSLPPYGTSLKWPKEDLIGFNEFHNDPKTAIRQAENLKREIEVIQY